MDNKQFEDFLDHFLVICIDNKQYSILCTTDNKFNNCVWFQQRWDTREEAVEARRKIYKFLKEWIKEEETWE